MFKKFALAMSTVALLGACSEPSSVPEVSVEAPERQGIIGGDKVDSSHIVAKSTVALYDPKAGALCSGTLISKELVLTAAHCIDPSSDQLIVYFGQDLSKPAESLVRKALKAVQHKDYNPERMEDTADIAMVRFSGELPPGFAPVALFNDFASLKKGSKVRVAGYGLNWAWGIKRGSGVLRTTELKVKEPVYGQTEIMIDQSIRKGVCSGDSGGPAYIEKNGKLFLMGVVSRGDSIPIPLTPDCFIMSIFTRVDAYVPWIKETGQMLLAIQ